MWIGERDLSDIRGKEFSKLRDLIAANGWKRCMQRQAYWIGDTQHIPDDNSIYRVYVSADTGHVKITCIGIESVDMVLDGNYDTIEALPDWMREKLTLLSMLSPTPPTEPVVGVGRRINDEIYWVFC